MKIRGSKETCASKFEEGKREQVRHIRSFAKNGLFPTQNCQKTHFPSEDRARRGEPALLWPANTKTVVFWLDRAVLRHKNSLADSRFDRAGSPAEWEATRKASRFSNNIDCASQSITSQYRTYAKRISHTMARMPRRMHILPHASFRRPWRSPVGRCQ